VKREAKVFFKKKKTKALKHAVLISFLVPSNFFCFLSVRLGPHLPVPPCGWFSCTAVYSRLMVVVVVVYNSNSVVVVHFLMSTTERKSPKKRIKPLLPSRLLTLGALQLFPTAKWYLNFFLDVDPQKKRKKSIGKWVPWVRRRLSFFFFLFLEIFYVTKLAI
jgi:hypothetical protein